MAPRGTTVETELPWFEADLHDFLQSGSDFKIMRRIECHAMASDQGKLTPPMELDSIYTGGVRLAAAPQRIVVLDSSFNPPTKAHKRMAVEGLVHSGWRGTRLLLVLSINNADKAAATPASFEERWGMMGSLAKDIAAHCWDLQLQALEKAGDAQRKRPRIDETPWFGIDMALSTLPYFHQKSAALARVEPEAFSGMRVACAEQILLVGYDTLIRILNPKYYAPEPMEVALAPMFERASLRVMLRADAVMTELWEQRKQVSDMRLGRDGRRLPWAWRERIIVVEVAHTDRDAETECVSSTRARAAAAQEDWPLLEKQVPLPVATWIRDRGLYKADDRGGYGSPAPRGYGSSAPYSDGSPAPYSSPALRSGGNLAPHDHGNLTSQSYGNLAPHDHRSPVSQGYGSLASHSHGSPALASGGSLASNNHRNSGLYSAGSPVPYSVGNLVLRSAGTVAPQGYGSAASHDYGSPVSYSDASPTPYGEWTPGPFSEGTPTIHGKGTTPCNDASPPPHSEANPAVYGKGSPAVHSDTPTPYSEGTPAPYDENVTAYSEVNPEVCSEASAPYGDANPTLHNNRHRALGDPGDVPSHNYGIPALYSEEIPELYSELYGNRGLASYHDEGWAFNNEEPG
ncbi:cytidylyltransferase [Magnaporthiopsis poae ATCC 64411]|uniref:Cytidylyltransferase n=1 Tax=Magnaporthiopsis poae (strain ATCC 64411 / 73-15) TaxID=644358 RepID=A0A0C4E3D8_MAGP6|nr:cytidylyltransferase [Magnaporthiopsis poae ATCC 64411]